VGAPADSNTIASIFSELAKKNTSGMMEIPTGSLRFVWLWLQAHSQALLRIDTIHFGFELELNKRRGFASPSKNQLFLLLRI
jgi:hypothetical protein